MRDANRIEPFLKEFSEIWEKCPDLRFGQLVYILNGGCDIFDVEDDLWLQKIKSFNKGIS